MADKHIAGQFRAIFIFHEPTSDKINTNKLIRKFDLERLIISPYHHGLEKLQMTTRMMIQLQREIHAHNIKQAQLLSTYNVPAGNILKSVMKFSVYFHYCTCLCSRLLRFS